MANSSASGAKVPQEDPNDEHELKTYDPQKCYLLKLPIELLYKIFKELRGGDLADLQDTCKQMNLAISRYKVSCRQYYHENQAISLFEHRVFLLLIDHLERNKLSIVQEEGEEFIAECVAKYKRWMSYPRVDIGVDLKFRTHIPNHKIINEECGIHLFI